MFAKPAKRKTFSELRTAERERAKRSALKALRRAKKTAEQSGTKLSEWEDEFLGSVEGRLQTYGRAFGDPEKGNLSASLSVRQTVKVKEIAAKASGKQKPRSGFKSRSRQKEI